jgi:hypothetical protein
MATAKTTAITKSKALVPRMPGNRARCSWAVSFDNLTLGGPVGQQTLSQALDEYDAAPPARRKTLEPAIYQQIIWFRSKLAKGLDEDERHDLERRIAAYSNSLVRRKRFRG